MSAEIGRVLGGRYRLIAPIGLGASAQVYLADDVRLRRRVALKMLHEALADDAEFLRRFRAEAQAAAALSHPNVMAVYDWGDDEIAFIVTEYLGGGSLRAMLDHGGLLSPSQALSVGLEAARALDYAHRRGFVHRDIKPANLLFGEEQRLRIADFGLARALAEAAWTEPQGAMLGTARYASPEQAKGEKLSGKADVYALALVLVEAVTGEVPFTADTTIGTLMARVDRQLEVPEALGPLQRVLLRAGHPDPERRIDARAMAGGLLRAAKELPRPQPLPLAGALPPAGLLSVDDDPTIHAPAPLAPVDGHADGLDGRSSGTDLADDDLTDDDLDLAPPDWVNQAEPVAIDPEPVAERVVVLPAGAAAGTVAVAVDDDTDGTDTDGSDTGGMDTDGTDTDGGDAGESGIPTDAEEATAVVDGAEVVDVRDGGPESDPDPEPASSAAVRTAATPATSSSGGSVESERAPAGRTAVLERTVVPRSDTAEHPQVDVDLVADADAEPRRRRWPWILAVFVLLIGGAGIAFAAITAGDDDPTPAQPALVLPVPNVAGLQQAQAEELLENAGWTTTTTTKRQNDTVRGEVLAMTPEPGTRLARDRSVALVVSEGQEFVTLPTDIAGQPLEDVEAALTELGLVAEVVARTYDEEVGKDSIIGYAEGTAPEIERGSTVGLVASDGPQPRTVPNAKGRSEDEATALIEGQQLEVAVNRSYSDDVAEGVVISQLPRSGSEVPRGATVTIEVSRGPDTVKVPSVASASTPAQAAQILRDVGLVAGSVSGPADGSPAATSPPTGTDVRKGSKVDIILR